MQCGPTHCCLIYDPAFIQRISNLIMLSSKQRGNNLVLHLPYCLDVFLREFACASLEKSQVWFTYLLLLLRDSSSVLRRHWYYGRVSLLNEVNEALSPNKSLEKRLTLFNILHIILEVEDIICTIPLLVGSCFIARMRSDLPWILVLVLLECCRIVEIFKSVD